MFLLVLNGSHLLLSNFGWTISPRKWACWLKQGTTNNSPKDFDRTKIRELQKLLFTLSLSLIFIFCLSNGNSKTCHILWLTWRLYFANFKIGSNLKFIRWIQKSMKIYFIQASLLLFKVKQSMCVTKASIVDVDVHTMMTGSLNQNWCQEGLLILIQLFDISISNRRMYLFDFMIYHFEKEVDT